MARLLMAVLVSAVALAVVDRKREWNMAMATAATGIAGSLCSVWLTSKSKWSINANSQTKKPGASGETGQE